MLKLNETLSSIQGEVDALLRKFQPTEVPADPRFNSPEGVLFRKALALIADERDWCQGATHRVRDGRDQYCSHGASLMLVNRDHSDKRHIKVYCALSRAMHDIVTYNNTHTHAEVIAKWHEAGLANGWL